MSRGNNSLARGLAGAEQQMADDMNHINDDVLQSQRQSSHKAKQGINVLSNQADGYNGIRNGDQSRNRAGNDYTGNDKGAFGQNAFSSNKTDQRKANEISAS